MAICKKAKHKSYAGALKNITAMKQKRGGKFGAYFCAGCNAYHITSNTAGRNKFVKFKD